MKAVAVSPGKPDPIHLRDVPKPSLDEIPAGRGVLVRVLRVGLVGTDKEVNAGEYGTPPPGDDYLVLSSVTGGSRSVEVPADRINLGFVLGNKVVVGTGNANRDHFEEGVRDLANAELQWPGWLPKLLTHPIEGLDRYREAMRLLTEGKDVIKVFVKVSEGP
jgi:threonine dehydrogenase-like Zn-dependent dehydrogenase